MTLSILQFDHKTFFEFWGNPLCEAETLYAFFQINSTSSALSQTDLFWLSVFVFCELFSHKKLTSSDHEWFLDWEISSKILSDIEKKFRQLSRVTEGFLTYKNIRLDVICDASLRSESRRAYDWAVYAPFYATSD